MELVEGQTLAERIARGPLPLEETLRIAWQITEALEYSHEEGVIHRNLKPGNVKITPEGSVKVLDFGLAKLAAEARSGMPAGSTLTMRETQSGGILGTAAYMAPEQARGQTIDKRVDICAFGAALYEMLTGVRPFQGYTFTDTLAAVLNAEPDWERVPVKAQRLQRACLEKDLVPGKSICERSASDRPFFRSRTPSLRGPEERGVIRTNPTPAEERCCQCTSSGSPLPASQKRPSDASN